MRTSILAAIVAFGTAAAVPALAQQSTGSSSQQQKRIKALRLATPESPDLWENKKGRVRLVMFPVNQIRKATRPRRPPCNQSAANSNRSNLVKRTVIGVKTVESVATGEPTRATGIIWDKGE